MVRIMVSNDWAAGKKKQGVLSSRSSQTKYIISEGILRHEDLKEAFEERAAIMEYEGGLPRKEAERLAYEIVYGKHKIA